MDNENNQTAGDNVETAVAGPKEKAIFFLKTLIELIENDRVRADALDGLNVEQILEMAEVEAFKAVEGSQKIIDRDS